MQKRIFGIETEYAIIAYCGGQTIAGHKIAGPLFVPLGRAAIFLGNGARAYNDVGAHPEYATPECASTRDLVTHDKAGERIFEGLARDLEERLSRHHGKRVTVLVIKNNTDTFGTTYGTHENYLIPRYIGSDGLDLHHVAAETMAFFATRQLLVGAGKVQRTAEGTVYCFSQRAEYMEEPVGHFSTSKRGLITIRDDHHADVEKYRRLHLIVGDSNMSETTTMLKVGSTDLILRMMEAGESFADLKLRSPIADMKRINADLTGRTQLLLFNGQYISALQLQQEFLQRASRFVQTHGLAGDPAIEAVLDLWERTLQAIELKKPELVDREIDWAIKLSAIRNVQKKFPGMDLSHPRIAQLDVAYHDICRERGVYYRLEKAGKVARFTTDLDIFRAKTVAPTDTRAHLRGDFIKKATAAEVDHLEDWASLSLRTGPAAGKELILDPFQHENSRVARRLHDTAIWRQRTGHRGRASQPAES